MAENLTVIIRDEMLGKQAPSHELRLTFSVDEVAVRDIIAERVRMEIDQYERKVVTSFANNLVAPSDAELRLNEAKKTMKYRPIDADKQVEVAFKAFERNGFFIIVGDRQVESLDERVSLTDNPDISFVKLTPLVGG